MTVLTIEDLAKQLSVRWPAILNSRIESQRQLQRLEAACRPLVVPDTSLVVFGSLARLEFTPQSDIDWTLLVDGFTVPEHLTVARNISTALADLIPKGPGRTGVFGNMASSHNLIHYIGGDDDTNANTTRRTLLLLESRPVGEGEAYKRVRNNLLKRYLEEDLGLWRTSTTRKIPHFLLNDFARYWRTMTVDFADKQHDRFFEGFALRKINLRMSRKLLYIAGLLACFRCHLEFGNEHDRLEFFSKDNSLEVAALLRSFLDLPPLDLAATVLYQFIGATPEVKDFFSAYDDFLSILADESKRNVLERLDPHQLETDSVYLEVRNISHRFRDAISGIFLNPKNVIGELTINYGVF